MDLFDLIMHEVRRQRSLDPELVHSAIEESLTLEESTIAKEFLERAHKLPTPGPRDLYELFDDILEEHDHS